MMPTDLSKWISWLSDFGSWGAEVATFVGLCCLVALIIAYLFKGHLYLNTPEQVNGSTEQSLGKEIVKSENQTGDITGAVVNNVVTNHNYHYGAPIVQVLESPLQIGALLDELGKIYSPAPPAVQYGVLETPLDQQILQAISEIPAEISNAEAEKYEACVQEAKDQKLAVQIDQEFRPRIVEAARLMDAVIRGWSNSSALKILKSENIFLDLRETLTFTSYQLESNGLSQENSNVAAIYEFSNGAKWQLYLKHGMVRSSEVIASKWSAPTKLEYPMLRLLEEFSDENKTLATIWFHQETKALGMIFQAKGQVGKETQRFIDELEKSGVEGVDLVSATAIALLKELEVATRKRR